MVNTIKFSQFVAANLSNAANMYVGFGGGSNIKTPFVTSWQTAGRPTPFPGVIGFNTDLGQYEFWNGAAWIQLAAGGSGSVNLGSANELAYYATSSTAVSGLPTGNNGVLVTSNTGVPSISSTLPAALTIPQPNIVGITDGSSAAVGSVGEVIFAEVDIGSAINLTPNSTIMITNITLSAGDWDVWAVAATNPQAATITVNYNAAISLSATVLPALTINTPLSRITNVTGSATEAISMVVGPGVKNVTVPTPIYLVMNCNFSAGLLGGYGYLIARRIR